LESSYLYTVSRKVKPPKFCNNNCKPALNYVNSKYTKQYLFVLSMLILIRTLIPINRFLFLFYKLLSQSQTLVSDVTYGITLHYIT